MKSDSRLRVVTTIDEDDLKPPDAAARTMVGRWRWQEGRETAVVAPTPSGPPSRPAVLFDLDGTLIDSVYQHVLAWRDALEAEGIDLPVWGIHRRVGMSGGLLARALLREIGKPLSTEQARRLQEQHEQAFARYARGVRPLPGARELLETLSGLGVPWAIATSGRRPRASWGVQLLAPASDPAPLITHDDVSFAKPDPDLFLAAAAALGARIEDAVVVGDSVWDLLAARRARALGVGLLSGGYGREELERAGAFRVYQDPQDLIDHLDEIGIRRT